MCTITVEFHKDTPKEYRYQIRELVKLITRLATDPDCRPALGMLSCKGIKRPWTKSAQVNSMLAILVPVLDSATLRNPEFNTYWINSVKINSHPAPSIHLLFDELDKIC